MKTQSFFIRLFAGNILLVGLIVSIAAMVSYRYLNSNYQNQLHQQQQLDTQNAAIHFEQNWFKNGKINSAQIADDCRRMYKSTPMRLTVIALDGKVLGDSQAAPGKMENHDTKDRPEIQGALAGNATYDTRASETLATEYRYYAVPVKVNGKVVGVARIAMECRQIAQGSSLIRNALLWAAIGAVVVAVILGLLLSWIWYAPLSQLTKAARDIASGELDNRVSISGAAELADLSTALNNMRENLAKQIRTIATQRTNLQTVVTNLREGVIALTGDGQVVLINNAARKLLEVKIESPVGKSLQEIVRIPDVAEAFMRARRTQGVSGDQFDIVTHGAMRTVDLTAVAVDQSASDAEENIEVLLVVRDITDLARMATIKSEFVANASHELRTPIATIRAAVDSLGELGPADIEEFSRMRDILDRHASRLESIANDLLDLHLIETSKGRLRLSDVSTNMIAQWMEDHFFDRAREKEITLKISPADPSVEFTTDRTLVQLILQNLLDNAMKFTEPGGVVSCEISREETGLQFRVTDTGMGIAPQHQARVFERFYQVESSRTGDAKKRGTGLGLAIVKHAAERLGAEITLESQPGSGTCFTVLLPIAKAIHV